MLPKAKPKPISLAESASRAPARTGTMLNSAPVRATALVRPTTPTRTKPALADKARSCAPNGGGRLAGAAER